jgi:hypothetical protein
MPEESIVTGDIPKVRIGARGANVPVLLRIGKVSLPP